MHSQPDDFLTPYQKPPPVIRALYHELYYVIQCIHHKEKIASRNGAKPRAFQKKHRELLAFLTPAQSNPAFKMKYDGIVQSFLDNTITCLEDHYCSKLGTRTGSHFVIRIC